MRTKRFSIGDCKAADSQFKVVADIWFLKDYAVGYFRDMKGIESERARLKECDGILPTVRDWRIYKKSGRRWELI